jgi:hypothetical protein
LTVASRRRRFTFFATRLGLSNLDRRTTIVDVAGEFIHADPSFGYRFRAWPAWEPAPVRLTSSDDARAEPPDLSRNVHTAAPAD